MKLANVAKKFDTVVATDAYGSATFNCQLAPLDLYKIEGAAVLRRQMSCAPGTVTPARGVVDIGGQKYLLGHSTPDYWNGAPIRTNYVLQGVDGLADLNSISGALAGVAPVQAYIAMVFARYLPDSADSSKYPPQYQAFLAGVESAPADSLIYADSKWYIVKEAYEGESGLKVALANVLDDPVFETASFGARTYVPATDSYSGGTVSAPVMRVKWQEHFRYLTKGSTDYVRGDMQMFVRKAVVATVNPSDTLALSDGTWTVLSVLDEGAVWSLHVRRA